MDGPNPSMTTPGSSNGITTTVDQIDHHLPASPFLDPRVHFDKTTNKWQFEDDDGREYEWIESKQTWTPIIDESLWLAQQAAYKVEGVDENIPVPSHSKKDKKQIKLEKQLLKKANGPGTKRSHEASAESSASSNQRNTAIYVSRLPLDTTTDELKDCFSRAGLVLVDEENRPKIKLYKDEKTAMFNGSALIVFLKPESVDLAIRLFDDTSLRLGSASDQDRMQVSRAEFSHKKKPTNPQADHHEENSKDPPHQDFHQRKKRAKKVEKLKSKLEEWDSDDDHINPNAIQPRFSKIVVLKYMFTLTELQEDPTLLIDLKEDVREECELLGNVTNVTLYDLEPDGIMTVKFKEPIAAQACILKMNARFFAGRKIVAFLYDGKHRYRKSGPGTTGHTNPLDNDGDQDAEEKKRLEEFAKFLEEQ